MKIYYFKTKDRLSFSNIFIKENGEEPEVMEITNEEYERIIGGKEKADVVNEKLVFELLPPSQGDLIKAEKAELKAKLEAGTATQEDITNALKILL